MSSTVRRLVLAAAAIATLLTWNSALAAGGPRAGAPTHQGGPHLMLAFGSASKSSTHGSHSSGGGGSHTKAAPGPHNSCCTPPLINNGGPVESPANVYLDFWGPQWSAGWPDVAANPCGGGYNNQCVSVGPTSYPNAAATVQTYLSGFFSAITGSTTPTWNRSQSQYGSQMPPVYGGAWTDTTSVPPAGVVTDNCVVSLCLIDQPPGAVGTAETAANQLGTEALQAEAHFGYSPNADYMIMLPKGAAPAGFAAIYCAYHDEIYDSQGRRISYSVIPYMPDASFGCGENYINTTDDAYGHGFLDGYSIVAGHEFAEAETDPLPFTAPAWQASDGSENGDICAWGTVGTYPAGNITAATGFWAVQSLWSNSANACVMN